jgi:hypothetical protein
VGRRFVFASPGVTPPANDHLARDRSYLMARRSRLRPPASAEPKTEKPSPGLFPHELRSSDVVIDEQGNEWELAAGRS